MRAVEVMLEYIVKYQNNVTSSFLLTKAMSSIIEKGISITALCNSNVLMYKFDFDEWPSVSTNQDTVSKPYHGDIFHIREHWMDVFPEAKY